MVDFTNRFIKVEPQNQKMLNPELVSVVSMTPHEMTKCDIFQLLTNSAIVSGLKLKMHAISAASAKLQGAESCWLLSLQEL